MGAALSLCTAAHHPRRVRAVVSISGPPCAPVESRPLRLHSPASLPALLDETCTRTDWLGECARIACPVLVAAGSEDHCPTVALSRRVAATIPGARRHVVAGGSHCPNRSHREEVPAVVRSFLMEIGVIAPGASVSKRPVQED